MLPICTLMHHEKPRYRDHLLRLSAEDRRLRFGHVLNDDAIAAHVDKLDPADDRLIVGMDPSLAVVGAVHIAADDRGAAELAFSVETGWRGRGLGTDLARRAILWARNRGICRVVLCCLPENRAMRRLAAGIGMRFAAGDGICEGTLDLDRGTPLSAFREVALESAAALDLSLSASRNVLAGLGTQPPAPAVHPAARAAA